MEPAHYSHESWQLLSKVPTWLPHLTISGPALTIVVVKQPFWLKWTMGSSVVGESWCSPRPTLQHLPSSHVACSRLPRSPTPLQHLVLCFPLCWDPTGLGDCRGRLIGEELALLPKHDCLSAPLYNTGTLCAIPEVGTISEWPHFIVAIPQMASAVQMMQCGFHIGRPHVRSTALSRRSWKR